MQLNNSGAPCTFLTISTPEMFAKTCFGHFFPLQLLFEIIFFCMVVSVCLMTIELRADTHVQLRADTHVQFPRNMLCFVLILTSIRKC